MSTNRKDSNNSRLVWKRCCSSRSNSRTIICHGLQVVSQMYQDHPVRHNLISAFWTSEVSSHLNTGGTRASLVYLSSREGTSHSCILWKGPTVINLHQSGGPIFSHHNNTRGVSWEVINSRWPCSRFWQSSPTLFPSTKASVRCLVWLWSHLCSFYSTPKPWGISCPQSWCPKAITGVVSYIHLPMTGMLLTIRCFIVL